MFGRLAVDQCRLPRAPRLHQLIASSVGHFSRSPRMLSHNFRAATWRERSVDQVSRKKGKYRWFSCKSAGHCRGSWGCQKRPFRLLSGSSGRIHAQLLCTPVTILSISAKLLQVHYCKTNPGPTSNGLIRYVISRVSAGLAIVTVLRRRLVQTIPAGHCITSRVVQHKKSWYQPPSCTVNVLKGSSIIV